MKKLLLLTLALFPTLFAFADLFGDGYYRIQNGYTKRYVYLLDDYGAQNVGSTSADVSAIELYKDLTRKISDPSTVMYVRNSSDSYYDIAAQGASIHNLFDAYVKVRAAGTYDGAAVYNIYASKSSMVKYLCDRWTDDDDDGLISVDKADAKLRYWYFNPINADSDEYFGITPTQTAGGKYFCPFFAGFPFTAKSAGMKFYVVTDIDPIGVAVITEVNGTVPAGTPVIVECSNPLATDNRLNIGEAAELGNVDGNKLSGVYFMNMRAKPHDNRVPFDRTSMRVLGVVDGKLAFVKADHDFIPRNEAYLNITDANLQNIDNFLVMTPAELQAYKAGVEIIPQDANVEVYSIDGRLVKSNFPKSEVSSLPKGLYILRTPSHSEKLLLK